MNTTNVVNIITQMLTQKYNLSCQCIVEPCHRQKKYIFCICFLITFIFLHADNIQNGAVLYHNNAIVCIFFFYQLLISTPLNRQP